MLVIHNLICVNNFLILFWQQLVEDLMKFRDEYFQNYPANNEEDKEKALIEKVDAALQIIAKYKEEFPGLYRKKRKMNT